MHENPIKQKVRLIEHLWLEEIHSSANNNARLCIIMGSQLVDYKMLKAFVMVQMSEESILKDVFLASHYPFKDPKDYCTKIIEGLGATIQAWNESEHLSIEQKVNWRPLIEPKNTETFLSDLSHLADALQLKKDEYLILSLLPEPNYHPSLMSEWLTEIALSYSYDNRVKLLVYDQYDSLLFDKCEKELDNKAIRLYPDLDIAGAMEQIAENGEVNAKNNNEKAIYYFQKNLLKFNKASGIGDEKSMLIHKKNCLEVCTTQSWPDMAAVVHFFHHGYFSAIENFPEAEHEIELAIDLTKEKSDFDKSVLVQYQIAKANMFLFQKKWEQSRLTYEEILSLFENINDPLLKNGVCQMLGMVYLEIGNNARAKEILGMGWDFVKQDTNYLQHLNARFYAVQMLKAGMNKHVDYIDTFNELSKLWGPNWENKLPSNDKSSIKEWQNSYQQLAYSQIH